MKSACLCVKTARPDVESLALQTGSTKPEPWQKEMALSAFLQGNPQFVSMALAGRIRCRLRARRKMERSVRRMIRSFVRLSPETPRSPASCRRPGIFPMWPAAAPVFRMGKVEEILVAEVDLKAGFGMFSKASPSAKQGRCMCWMPGDAPLPTEKLTGWCGRFRVSNRMY
ncbi:MAG: hypothetical protein R2875_13350 [Desulfobacterales bacterium]